MVIGNAVSYGHPEVEQVEQQQLPYSFFPKLLRELIIRDRHSVVVAGTHGKSTTAAMMATVLAKLGDDPSYFIGGVVRDLPASLWRGAGSVSVVEGDEYDSAFFAKVPKFSFYAATTLVITSIEYDHADIYPSLESINAVFTKEVLALPAQSCVLCCSDQENLQTLIAQWRAQARCRIVTYGRSPASEYHLEEVKSVGEAQEMRATTLDGRVLSWKLGVPGAHNALNSLAVLAVADLLKLDVPKVKTALAGFLGVKRRQEVRFDERGITVVEDFAHHPTAVRETLAAMRQRYAGRRLWAVFEPRSNTSRKKVFQVPYVDAFQGADMVVLCQVSARSNDTSSDLIDVGDLGKSIMAQGTPCLVLATAQQIAEQLAKDVTRGDVVLVMSNGSFGGLIDLLIQKLKS
ncbi:MAG: UDP-N-acetylmuramate dehydrogenase [Deltaproteobacteria bacterium]|nr:UDP-N-acetylmuramate dehydrogenase [Deltaproteobacteria bacterium]